MSKEYLTTYYDKVDAIMSARELTGTFEIVKERFCTMETYKLYRVSNEPTNDCIIKI